MHSEEYKKYVKEMRDWLNLQAHLPKDVDDHILYRFAHSCYFDMKKAQKAADLFFTVRGNSPEILSHRDLLAPYMQKFLKIVNVATLEVNGNTKLWLWQLNDPGLENYDYLTDVRFFFLTTDAWLLDETAKFYDSDIIFMDLKDVSIKMLTKLNMSIAKKLSKYQQEAIPLRLKQIHLVNTPSIMDKIFSIMKPLVKKEVFELIHFHQPKSDTLYKFIKKEDLPKDYGGIRESMNELMEKSMEEIMKKRDLLLNENLWVANVKKNKSATTEIRSFRSLAID